MQSILSKDTTYNQTGLYFRCDLRLTITPAMQPPVRRKATVTVEQALQKIPAIGESVG